MPPEPNKKIEELLQCHAQKRREESGADFELHPATRQLLQGEVTRTFTKSSLQAKSSILFAFWPRLAVAGIFTALFVVAILVLNTPKKSGSTFELSQRADAPHSPASAQLEVKAKEEPVSLQVSADKTAVAQRNIAPPVAALETRATDESAVAAKGAISRAVRMEEKLSESSVQISNSLGQSVQLADRKNELAKNSAKIATGSVGGTSQLDSVVAEPGSRASSAPATATVNLYADAESLARQKFVQQDLRAKYRRNFLSPAQPKILQSFEVVRAGNQIQFYDSDGSVYAGEIINPVKEISGKKDLQGRAEQVSEFAFRVAGTNQQMKQVVTFTGNYLPTETDRGLNRKTPSPTVDTFSAGEFKKQSINSQNGLINGKVSIGGTNEFEVQAAEVAK